MPNLFAGVHVALNAILAHQTTVEVIEHNVANVNTPGYRRQEAVLKAGPAVITQGAIYGMGVGQIGTGVTIEKIRRFSMDFFDARYRNEAQESSRWNVESTILQQLEATMAETSADGLIPRLDAFWGSWQSLSVDPTNTSIRAVVLDEAKSLVDAVNNRALQLRTLRIDQDLAISQRVDEVNLIAEQLARLNAETTRVISMGEQPNDLLDERERLLDRLAELTGAISTSQLNGETMVSINGHILVQGHEAFKLETYRDPADTSILRIRWEDGQAFTARTGEVAGLFDARDNVIVDQIGKLDSLAAALITRVNEVHRAGYAPGKVSMTQALPETVLGFAAGSLDVGQTELPGGDYHVETQFSGGTWQFRLLDNSGSPVTIRLSDGSGYSNNWQDIPTGTGSLINYDTGRGLQIQFGSDPVLYSSGAFGTTAARITFHEQQDFFTGTDAITLGVNTALDDTSLIASAAVPGAPGDGEVARQLFNVRNERLMNSSTATINSYYTGTIAELGLTIKRAVANAENRKLVTDALDLQRTSTSGVSLNEEAANLVKAQKAYEAAARLMTVIDEMLDKVINGMGIVGR